MNLVQTLRAANRAGSLRVEYSIGKMYSCCLLGSPCKGHMEVPLFLPPPTLWKRGEMVLLSAIQPWAGGRMETERNT